MIYYPNNIHKTNSLNHLEEWTKTISLLPNISISSSFLSAFFFLLFIFSTAISASDKENDQNDRGSYYSTLFLAEEEQKNAEIKTITLKKINFKHEETVFGKAISTEPLLNLSNQFQTASAKQKIAKLHLIRAKEQMAHFKRLHKNASLPTRKLQKQQAIIQLEQINYNESTRQTNTLVKKIKLQWGNILAKWITDQSSLQRERLFDGKLTLLKILIPEKDAIQKENNTIFISPTGDRNTAFLASFINILPQVENDSQGNLFLYQSANTNIKANMSFTAWVSDAHENQLGIVIPESSIVWHLGQSFVFIKINEEHFIRQKISPLISISRGYFVHNQLKEGNKIVISGAQTLLSHALKAQIPDEDDD